MGATIINLTPHTVNVISPEFLEPVPYNGYKVVNENYACTTYPSQGIARAQSEQELVNSIEQPLDIIPVYKVRYGHPEGLPDYEDDVYYIVSTLTANAAKAAGRRTDDLLIPNGMVRDSDGSIIGCTSFAVV